MRKIKLVRKSFGVLAAMLTMTSVVACFALIPVAIYYYGTPKGYVATAEVPRPAQQVYSKAVSMAEEKAAQGQLKITKKDDTNLLIEVTDGKQTASLKAIPVDSDKSKMIVTADVPEEKEKEKEKGKEKEKEMEQELALRIVNNMCTQLDTKCTIVK
jgi:hypothetical protein